MIEVYKITQVQQMWVGLEFGSFIEMKCMEVNMQLMKTAVGIMVVQNHVIHMGKTEILCFFQGLFVKEVCFV